MKQIRMSVFETNSSSTHSLMIVSKEEWERFKSGELFYDEWEDKLVETKEEDEPIRYLDFYAYHEFVREMDEVFREYTTKNGDTIVIFGYYGYDG